MLGVVLTVAIVGVALLAAAVLTDNTVVALVVIVVAIVGLVLLARDWLADRQQHQSPHVPPEDVVAGDTAEPHAVSHEEGLEPDEFEPDVPYDDDASDERATPPRDSD